MKRYLIVFFSILIPCSVFLIANYTIVQMAGEMTPYSEIAKWQQEGPDRVYGPLFNNDHVSYKYNLFEQRKSQIVIAGSSRALEHQQNFYSQEITNMGRSINTLKEALRFLHYIETRPEVRTVVLITDFWWFKGTLNLNFKASDPIYSQGSERSLDMFFLPIMYAIQGKVNIKKIVAAKLLNNTRSKIGIRSIQYGDGFRAEGAREDCNAPIPRKTKAIMRQEMAKMLGKDRFTYSTKLRYYEIDCFFKSIAGLEEAGKEIIVILSPLSPMLYHEVMTNPQFSYIPKTLEYFKKYPLHNYMNPQDLDLDYSYFRDFFHTGPHAEAKLLLALAKKDARVQRIIDSKFLTNFLKTNHVAPLPIIQKTD